MLTSEQPEIAAKKRLPEGFSAAGLCPFSNIQLGRQEVRRDGGEALLVQGGIVHFDHLLIGNRSLQLLQRGPGFRQSAWKVRAVDQHSIIGREVVAVVL